MRLPSWLAPLLVLLLPLAGAAAVEQRGVATSPTYADIRVQWQAEPGTTGGMVVHGYVHNGRAYAVDSVRLQVESLGPQGEVLSRGLEHVRPSIGPFGRTYFEIPLARGGASYRVTILSVDFIFPGDERRRRW
jgi:hypothetical protein